MQSLRSFQKLISKTPSFPIYITNSVTADGGPRIGDENQMYKITFEDNGSRKALTSSGRTETKVFRTYTEAEIIRTSLEKYSMYDKKWAIEQLESNPKVTE